MSALPGQLSVLMSSTVKSGVDGLYLTDDFPVLVNDSPNFVRCGPSVARHTVGLRSVHSLLEQGP